MRVLVTGCNGQVGKELLSQATGFGFAAVGKARDGLDICDLESVKKAVNSLRPEAIINAAAYTAVDAAEMDQDRAYAVNESGTKHLALLCEELGIPFLHISTDYVFDGKSDGAYSEEDRVNPLGVYGASKLAGEKAAQMFCKRTIILRTSWVFSEHGNNFVKTMLRLGAERELLSVVSDQVGGPTSAKDIALALLSMLKKLPDLLEEGREPWGVYHYGGSPATSWYLFAKEIFDQAQKKGHPLKLKEFTEISAKDYPVQAERPDNSVFDCKKIKTMFGIEQPDWRQALQVVIGKL